MFKVKLYHKPFFKVKMEIEIEESTLKRLDELRGNWSYDKFLQCLIDYCK